MHGENMNIECPRVAYYLSVWREWMLRPGLHLGYPAASFPFFGSGLASVEDLEDETDDAAAIVMDRIIEDLPMTEKTAVTHYVLSAVFRGRDLPGAWGRALRKIEMGLRAEGWL